MNVSWPYFDSMSSTPLDSRVYAAMQPFLTSNYANASSKLYPMAWDARRAVEKAQSQLEAIHSGMSWNFHSGATEGILSVILGFARWADHPLILTSPYEHEAVASAIQTTQQFFPQLRCETLNYFENGQPDYDALNARIKKHSGHVLLSLIHAQNEIGLILDVSTLVASLYDRERVYLHLDSSQSLGKHLQDRALEDVDFVNFSAHKIYGPKGVGALGRSSRTQKVYEPLIVGGHQQSGQRGGTLPTSQIVGMGEAIELAEKEKTEWIRKSTEWTNQLHQFLRTEFPDVLFSSANPTQPGALPHLLNFCLPSHTSSEIQKALWGIAYSTGSACSSEKIGLSRALDWRGRTLAEAQSSLRIAFHRETQSSDLESLKAHLLRLKS